MKPAARDPIPGAPTTSAPPRAARPRASSYRGRVFEDDLDADSRWAMGEGNRFLEGEGRVQQALVRITNRLNELGVPYCAVVDEARSARYKVEYLVSNDPEIARKYDMHDESEFWDAGDEPAGTAS